MTNAPKPPKRRGRKLILALVAIAALVSWWFWPRGDARFVGDWSVYVEGSDTPLRSTYTLYSNGCGKTVDLESGRTLHFFWRIQDDHFVMGTDTGLLKPVYELVAVALRKTTNHTLMPRTRMFDIVTAPGHDGRDAITIHRNKSRTEAEMSLRRVPE